MTHLRPLVLLLAACSGAMPGPAGPDGDADGDGWTPANGDCDDTDADVNPSAVDVPLDEIDQDCDGVDAEALTAAALQPGDLQITEFMADPLAVEPAYGEWVEIRNHLDQPVDLQGLLLRDNERDDAFIGGTAVVPAGGYLVVGGALSPELTGGAPVSVVWEADMGLSNSADAFVIEANGVVLDEVEWDPSWPVSDGLSVGLDPDATDPTEVSSWCVGTELYGVAGYGSPGQPNPPCPAPFAGIDAWELEVGDLLITEVLQSPSRVEDDYGEWIEVYNPGDEPVNLEGLTLVSDDGDAADIDTRAVVEPGAYAVLAGFADPRINGGLDPVWTWEWDYGLKGSGMQIQLAYGTFVVDAIRYDNGITFPDPAGASMSLDPSALDEAANDDGANWCEGVDPYGDGDLGTPGAANPPCPTVAGEVPRPGDLVITEIMFDPAAVDGDVGEWFEVANPGGDTLDLSGVVVSDDGGNSYTLPEATTLGAGELLVLGRDGDRTTNGDAAVDIVYGDSIKWGNGGDSVILALAGTIIDEVTYDKGWGAGNGASLSLNPGDVDAVLNDGAAAWCPASSSYGDGDLGTPGAPNDPC